MDIKDIQEKLTMINVTSMTSESVAEYEHEVDECVHFLERKLEMEMEMKLRLSNRIGIVQSQVTELWDKVDKARRRESDISNRVTAWAEHLAEMMQEIKSKKAKMGMTMNSSAALSAEIQQSLEFLAEKREVVQRMREEIDLRRHLHKQQLKDLKTDCDLEKKRFEYWTNQSTEIEKVLQVLKEQRELLGQRIADERRMEQEQKRMLEDLEKMLKTAGKKREILDENANLVASFSSLTEECT